jgi:prepilin-type N-terminal cleavage/methylation domain-containing protein
MRTLRRHSRHQRRRSGFTIIEVLIVLAIASLILLIIFLVVPQLRRNERNYSRRHSVEYVASQMDEYRNLNGHYPETTAEGTSFVNDYVSGNIPGSMTVDFRDISGPHSYTPPLDEIAIEYGHWCNHYGDGDAATDPIAGTDINHQMYVIWTSIEDNQTFCVDDHG